VAKARLAVLKVRFVLAIDVREITSPHVRLAVVWWHKGGLLQHRLANTKNRL